MFCMLPSHYLSPIHIIGDRYIDNDLKYEYIKHK